MCCCTFTARYKLCNYRTDTIIISCKNELSIGSLQDSDQIIVFWNRVLVLRRAVPPVSQPFSRILQGTAG